LRTLCIAGSVFLLGLQETRALGTEPGQGAGPARREFHVASKKFAYSPGRLEVQKDDIVKVVFSADDIAHTFTIDAYRVSKRAAPGHSVTFEFRADQAGTFPFYCALQAEDGCKDMHGELVVK
jgi:nitrous-oxide reductase